LKAENQKQEMDEKLVFDVGMHRGEDTGYYLLKGFRVIGIDADPSLINLAKKKFAKHYNHRQIELLQFAVCNVDNADFEFYLSVKSIWNSLDKNISNRLNSYKETIIVKSRSLSSLFVEFGTPFYCKVDLEGYDNKSLQVLKGMTDLPAFISCESECIGESETITEDEALETLKILHALGYTKFKLVDQLTLRPLKPNVHFYNDDLYIQKKVGLIQKIRNRIFPEKINNYHSQLSEKFGYKFEYGSSGPFGEDIEGDWVNFNTAKEMLLFHRRDYFGLSKANNFSFWCDWHASRL